MPDTADRENSDVSPETDNRHQLAAAPAVPAIADQVFTLIRDMSAWVKVWDEAFIIIPISLAFLSVLFAATLVT